MFFFWYYGYMEKTSLKKKIPTPHDKPSGPSYKSAFHPIRMRDIQSQGQLSGCDCGLPTSMVDQTRHSYWAHIDTEADYWLRIGSVSAL